MKQGLQDKLAECMAELNEIDSIIKILSPFSKEIQYLTRYAIIRASGTAEIVYRSIVADYFSKFSDCRIDKYIDLTVRSGSMSAKYEIMVKLLGKFDDKWAQDFKSLVKSNPEGQKIIDASNSLVSNRHAFAHGHPTSATFTNIKEYYEDVMKLIDIFDRVVY